MNVFTDDTQMRGVTIGKNSYKELQKARSRLYEELPVANEI